MRFITVLFLIVIVSGYSGNVSAASGRHFDGNAASDGRVTLQNNDGVVWGREDKHPQRWMVAINVPADSSVTQASQKEPQSSSDNSESWLSVQLPLLKKIAFGVLLFAGFVICGRLISAVAPRKLAIIIKLLLFAALAAYLFKAYSEKFTELVSGVKEEVKDVQKALDKRNEKVQQQEQ